MSDDRDTDRIDAALANYCPACRRHFAAPSIREIDGNHTHLDHRCPHCDYHYARWPKVTTTGATGDSQRRQP